MNLVLKFDSASNGGNVQGLKVIPDNQSDVITIKWNGSTSAQTFSWYSTKGYYVNNSSQPHDGYFELIYNGVSSMYSYTSLDNQVGGAYGGSGTIIRCNDGALWFTDDNNTHPSSWCNGWYLNDCYWELSFNNQGWHRSFLVEDSNSYQGRTVSAFMGTGWQPNTFINFRFKAYDINDNLVGGGDNLAWTFTLPQAVDCSNYGICPSKSSPNIITTSLSNNCPLSTVDLSSLTASNTPSGYILEFHTSNTLSTSNKLTILVVGAGTYYATFFNSLTNCYSDITPITVTINSCNSATLVDDSNTTPMNTSVSGSVTGNDTVTCTGTKTYRIKLGSEVNGTFTIDNSGNYNFTPTTNFIGNATAKYEVLCDGNVLGEANINISVTCVNVSGGIINGNSNTTLNVNETYSITGLTGTTPYTYTWSGATIVSGQGTNSVVITPTTNPTTLQCIVTNCSGNGIVTLTKPINVKLNCTPTIHFKYNCGTATNLVITKENTTESNRLISYDSNSGNLSFTSDIGTFNYLLTFTSNNLSNSILFKNITC